MLFLLAFRSIRQLGGVRVVLLMLLCVVVALAVAGVVLAAPAAQIIQPEPGDLPPLPGLPEPPRFVQECLNVTEISSMECDTLVHIFNEMNGVNWLNRTGWLTTNTPCQWFGLTCGLVEGQLRVTGMQLFFAVPDTGPGFPGNNLTGPIPPQIGQLDELRILNLNYNRLSGNLPEQIGYLDKLEQLQLVNTGLIGPLPGQIGYLTSLRVLNIRGNRFSGIIPTQFGFLTLLNTLEIGGTGTELSGELPPQIGLLTELIHLRIYESPGLNGSVPEAYANLQKLITLDFFGDNLQGEFPSWVGVLPNLAHLRLAGNNFTGVYPDGLRDRNLLSLYLSPTDVENHIPTWLHEFENLGTLYLGATPSRVYTGPFPDYLGAMEQLSSLNVIGNRLEGSLPVSIWTSPNLVQLGIQDSNLQLTLPFSIDLPSLTNLYLMGRNFTGQATPLAQVNTLKNLRLHYSGFSGELGWLMSLNDLITADLSNSSFSGPLPAGWAGLTDLQSINVERNRLSGTIPPDLADAPALTDVNLNFNALDTTNPNVLSLLQQSQADWRATQTLPPTNITVEPLATGVKLSWEPQGFINGPGFYEISLHTDGVPWAVHPGCPSDYYVPWSVETPIIHGKSSPDFILTGLCPHQSYNFLVSAVTLPHTENKNRVESEPEGPTIPVLTEAKSLQLSIISMESVTMTLKYENVITQTLQTAVAADPSKFLVTLVDLDGKDNTTIYLMAGGQPLPINGLPDPRIIEDGVPVLNPDLKEYDMGNNGVLTDGPAGNHLGAFIKWAIATYAPDVDIPVTVSFIGHGVALAPTARNLYCVFADSTKPQEAPECFPTSLQARFSDLPWTYPPLPSKQDINPEWTDATSKTMITPYTLARALDMGTDSGTHPLAVLDVVHCFGGTIEEFYELAYPPRPNPDAPFDPEFLYANVILGSPNYTYFGPDLVLESLLSADFTQDPVETAINMLVAYDETLDAADEFDGDPDVDHPRILMAVDARGGRLETIKQNLDELSGLLVARLTGPEPDDPPPPYPPEVAQERIRAAHIAASHYDTTLCSWEEQPQDWLLNEEDGLSDLYTLMRQIQNQFADDSEIAAAAAAVAGAVKPTDDGPDTWAVVETIREDGVPWFGGKSPSYWTFDPEAPGLAIYSDFVGMVNPETGEQTVGWQAYWYTSAAFEYTPPSPSSPHLPYYDNEHPLAFILPTAARPYTWADVLRLYWQGADGVGRVPASACTTNLPFVNERVWFLPLSVAPYESPFVAR